MRTKRGFYLEGDSEGDFFGSPILKLPVPTTVGMSSLFINLILKTPHYLQMNVLNERISKWAHLPFYHKRFSRYLHLQFEKEVFLSGRFSPYEIPDSGDNISNF